MLVSMAGADVSYIPGDEIEVSDEIADSWNVAGIAVKIGGDVDGVEADNDNRTASTNNRRSKNVSKA
jgi:hypothetical protein